MGGCGLLPALLVLSAMLLTPVLFIVYDKLIAPRFDASQAREADEISEQGNVIIAGHGRFGGILKIDVKSELNISCLKRREREEKERKRERERELPLFPHRRRGASLTCPTCTSVRECSIIQNPFKICDLECLRFMQFLGHY